jgi:hypothetical protein
MKTYLLTWHPYAYNIEAGEYLERVQDVTAHAGRQHGRWSTGKRNSEIEIGDRVFLFRQKRERGIVASGYTTSECHIDVHWRDRRRNGNFVSIEWDSWRPLEDRLTIETLEQKVPGFSWNHLQGSGIHLPDDDAAKVEKLWVA